MGLVNAGEKGDILFLKEGEMRRTRRDTERLMTNVTGRGFRDCR
jgi:hypothetical protein